MFSSTAAKDDNEITKYLFKLLERSTSEILQSLVEFSLAFSFLIFMIHLLGNFLIFADYSPHIIYAIFAKYRMITRWGSMEEYLYIWLLFFYAILSLWLGWMIMLRNGKRESSNSFKSCRIFFHFSSHPRWQALAHILWLKLILMSHLSLRSFVSHFSGILKLAKAAAGDFHLLVSLLSFPSWSP